jgi:ornithine cyclodeaminase/alanine dehydrogenase
LRLGDVTPGTFIAAVGADAPHKGELYPDLMARSKIVVDSLEQCLVMGDLHHAVTANFVGANSVYAALGEIATGRKAGRSCDHEITIFDSTGIAAQDVAAAVRIYDRARANSLGIAVVFGAKPKERALIPPTTPAREH